MKTVEVNLIEENNFIFSRRLKKELNVIANHPEEFKAPTILCFYGEPGVGKTTYAKALLGHLCVDFQYYPMNERNLRANFVDDEFKRFLMTGSLYADEDKRYSKGVLLDEFHNLAPKEQDKFKVVFEQVKDVIIIVCLNTTINKSINSVLTSPIKSRMHCVNFNILGDELIEVSHDVHVRYPSLTSEKIRAWLPDMRRINREGRLSELMLDS